MDRERRGPIHELTVAAVVPAPQEADASQFVFRSADQMVTPRGAEQFGIAGAIQRVKYERLLPAGQSAPVVFASHLPATRVAAQEGNVAAIGDEFF